MLQQWLNDEPNTTAKDLFIRLNTEIPNRFKQGQYRTLQRRVKDWRTSIARRVVLGCNYETETQVVTGRIDIDKSSCGLDHSLTGTSPPGPQDFRFPAIPMCDSSESRRANSSPLLVWPLGLRSSCVPALLL